MTPDRLQSIIPFVAVGLFILALLMFLLSLRYFRKSRTDFYWRRRRTAGQRGWRLFVWSLVIMFTSGMICVVMGVAGMINARHTPTASVAAVALGTPTVALTASTANATGA